MIRQVTNAVLMVRPTDFKYAVTSAQDNYFMGKPNMTNIEVRNQALREYDESLQKLRDLGINVLSFDKENYPQLKEVDLPDAVFPNNHFNTWDNGDITIYHMRSAERETEKLQHPFMFDLLRSAGFKINNIVQLERGSPEECLESTGSLILDKINKIAYASISQRTTPKLLENWAKIHNHQVVAFKSRDKSGRDIYHTNMLMSIGEKFAVLCKEVIDPDQSEYVYSKLKENREVIEITAEQCLGGNLGNCIQVNSVTGEGYLVMSQKAKNSLTLGQLTQIEKFVKVVALPIQIIEDVGGGSARCMIAEIYNPQS